MKIGKLSIFFKSPHLRIPKKNSFCYNVIFVIMKNVCLKCINFSVRTKDFSIEGTVAPGRLLCSKLDQSKSPGTTVPSIENSLLRTLLLRHVPIKKIVIFVVFKKKDMLLNETKLYSNCLVSEHNCEHM